MTYWVELDENEMELLHNACAEYMEYLQGRGVDLDKEPVTIADIPLSVLPRATFVGVRTLRQKLVRIAGADLT